ncbi:hypothetical protein C8R44DRAFT_788842, partial [Mycena epipterygia]
MKSAFVEETVWQLIRGRWYAALLGPFVLRVVWMASPFFILMLSPVSRTSPGVSTHIYLIRYPHVVSYVVCSMPYLVLFTFTFTRSTILTMNVFRL